MAGIRLTEDIEESTVMKLALLFGYGELGRHDVAKRC